MRRIVAGSLIGLACLATASCQMEHEKPLANHPSNFVPPDMMPHHHSDDAPAPAPQAQPRPFEPGRKVAFADRWFLTDARARRDLEGTPFGEQEIKEFWTRKGWQMTKAEEQYMAEVQTLMSRGLVTAVSRWGVCPYDPVYQALTAVTIMGARVERMQEFHFEVCENENELQRGTPRFKRLDNYAEDHPDGHGFQQGKPGHAPSSHPHDH